MTEQTNEQPRVYHRGEIISAPRPHWDKKEGRIKAQVICQYNDGSLLVKPDTGGHSYYVKLDQLN